jgi:hypothetical protein
LYEARDADLWEESSHTLWASEWVQYRHLWVIEISQIKAVVSMQPLEKISRNEHDRRFLVEKSGLEDVKLTGYDEDLPQDNND